MPLPKTQPLTYRLRAPQHYQPDPLSVYFAPEDAVLLDVAIFSATLGAFQSDESKYITPREMWLDTVVASASVGVVSDPAFSFQIMEVISQADGSQNIVVAQEYPTNTTTKFGTAQHPATRRRMQYISPGTELVCSVNNLQASDNDIQIVLRMYVRDVPNTPRQVGSGQ
ncbi:MAG: hypothetical protein ACRD4O_04150 [Bryobacteraceae bacterium]